MMLRLERDFLKRLAAHALNAVVPREAFIDDEELGIEEARDRQIFREHLLEKHQRLLAAGGLERVVIALVFLRRLHAAELLHIEPLTGEVLDETPALRIRQHARDLGAERGGLFQCAFGREREQRIVRQAAPEEIGEAAREFEVVQRPRALGGGSGARLRLLDENEARRAKHRLKPKSQRVWERHLLALHGTGGDAHELIHFRFFDWPTIRSRQQPREHRAQSVFILRRLVIESEHLVARRRPFFRQRTFHLDFVEKEARCGGRVVRRMRNPLRPGEGIQVLEHLLALGPESRGFGIVTRGHSL